MGAYCARRIISTELGMQLNIQEINVSKRSEAEAELMAEVPQYCGRVTLMGPDGPGIMQKLATVLTRHSLNISSLVSLRTAGTFI